MYEIRELDQLRDQVNDLPAAERAIDDLCAQAHAQAVAAGKPTDDLWHRFEVVDESGDTVMFREYNPDPSKAYVPLIEE